MTTTEKFHRIAIIVGHLMNDGMTDQQAVRKVATDLGLSEAAVLHCVKETRVI